MEDYMKFIGAGAVTLGALTTATAYYFFRNGTPPIHLACDLKNQAKVLQGKDCARVSRFCKDGKLLVYIDEEVRTLHDAFRHGARLSNDGPCLGWKPSSSEPYQWLSYNEVLSKAANIGAALKKHGQTAGARIGIYSQNRPEYCIVEQACYMYSMTIVPLYDTLGAESCSFILNQAEINLVICDKNTKVSNILSRMKETPKVKKIVVMEEVSGENKNKAQEFKVETIQYKDFEKLGSENPQEPNLAKPDDIAVVCYTSGTTGLPKGAMLTHENILSPVLSVCQLFTAAGYNVTNEDCLISYLPLAHSYERLCEVTTYINGAKIGFFQGDVKTLMDDIKELQPTVFPSVPRLLNRVYDKVVAGSSASAFKKMLFDMAMNSKGEELKKGIIRKNSLWDKLIFKKLQQSLGGKVRLITTGSAPLSPKVLHFLRCCVGCPVLEGYGQTECSAICSLTIPGDCESGTVGPPLSCNLLKVADVPDMNYFAKENKGEVCVKGANVFKGYLKDPEKTQEALDDEGWLHTGDIGEWLPNGTLKIIDRKKHIFKLAQGEYIAPEKIENTYVRSPLISQFYVHGDSLKSCLVGIVVPDYDVLPKFVQEKFDIKGTHEELAANKDVKKAILESITDIGKKAGLTSLEQVKDIYVYHELFSVENGLLTPTFKAKRNELKQFFAKQIEEMYSKLD
ncbi:hypothetical protein CHS0354_043146 [Potamilus streckersoni]|uniref:Long-chain-fatty-acid--CoA ligase n=1 Tax=Potamilus streckersoni TaxID=2493646 RepID=A0AAE0VT10_9BIVA|nr:hypothetical protein CHS0354_043146 [Potamilus streckersoni]